VRLLVVDDQSDSRQLLKRLLTIAGYEVEEASDVAEALTRLRATTTDLVISDIRMEAEDDGLQLLRLIRGELPYLPVILYLGFARIDDVVSAMRMGASAVLEFPIESTKILLAVERALAERSHRDVAHVDRDKSSKPHHGIVAASPAMVGVMAWISRIGATDLPALLVGETGTGKELVARALHQSSDRQIRSFVPVNCGAIPEGLFEAEIFGHSRGAFTGASRDKPGLLEVAHCGTLFLDEIGELPPVLQVRLLRFLESGEVRRLGETKERHVDVRVIAASNRELREEASHGRFRPDLFFRLSGAVCRIPPLRDRLQDLDALVDFWLPQLAGRLAPQVRDVSPGALSLLRAHSWPGNVRELRHVLERAVSFASGNVMTEQDMAAALEFVSVPTIDTAVHTGPGHESDRHRVLAALNKHRWSIHRTALSLGISRSTLWRKLRKYGIRKHDE